MTEGSDGSCASTQCEDERDRVIEKSRALEVPLVAVVVSNPYERTPGELAMGELAERSGGIVLWASSPSDLGPLFRRLPAILSGAKPTYSARFRILSSTGAFQSGRIVAGRLDWGSWDNSLPFAVQIP